MTIYRRYVNDLLRDDLIPTSLLARPELQALEAERRRLVAALDDIKPPKMGDSAAYVRARTRALREGTELPAPPPTVAEIQAAQEQYHRDRAAAEEALLRLGDDICATVANHPEWAQEAAATATGLREEAAEMRRKAEEAERRAADADVTTLWLRRVADDELFPPHYANEPAADQSHVVFNVTDPHLQDLIAASRTGQPL